MGRRKRVVSGRPIPESITPQSQLAPVYGGGANVNRAVESARDLASQVYPTLDPEMAAMFPQPNYDAYGMPIDVMQSELASGGAMYNPRLPGEDTPYGNTLIIDPNTGELMPQQVERAITDALLSDESVDMGMRNRPIGDSGLTPRDVDMALAQLRRRGFDQPDMQMTATPSPGTIGFMTGMNPDDLAVSSMASPGSEFNPLVDMAIDDAAAAAPSLPQDADFNMALEPFAGGNRPPDAGVSIKALLALRNLPPQVRKFLGPRMGMLPSLAGPAIGVGAAMSGDRDRPGMTTDATMRAPQMY